MTELYKAKYLLSLIDNTTTDDIRNDFINSICNLPKDYLNTIFIEIMSIIFDNKIYNADNIKLLLETEFVKLGLSELYGDYSNIKAIIDMSIDEYCNINNSSNILPNLYKSFILFADKQERITNKTYIYYAVLSCMVRLNGTLVDIELTRKIVDYLNTQDLKNMNKDIFCYLIRRTCSSIKTR